MRHIFRVLIALAVVQAVASCATTQGLEQRLNLVVGHNINEVISALGPPTQTYTMPNGNTIYSYVRSQTGVTPIYRTPTYTTPSTTTIQMNGNYGYAVTTPGQTYGGQVYGGQVYTNACTIQFIVDSTQTVRAYRYEGNSCRAVPLN